MAKSNAANHLKFETEMDPTCNYYNAYRILFISQ